MVDISKAVISEQAFVSLITSGLEVFDKEVLGLLLGTVHQDKLIIKSVLPYQVAFRKKSEVSIYEDHEEKVLKILNKIPGYSLLGDFHSHPHEKPRLSEQDRRNMHEDGIRFSLLMTIIKSQNKVKWHYSAKEKCMKGSFNGYLIIFKMYQREYSRKPVRLMKILCPYTKKYNKHNNLQ